MYQCRTMMYDLTSECMKLHFPAIISLKTAPFLYPFKIAQKGTN